MKTINSSDGSSLTLSADETSLETHRQTKPSLSSQTNHAWSNKVIAVNCLYQTPFNKDSKCLQLKHLLVLRPQ